MARNLGAEVQDRGQAQVKWGRAGCKEAAEVRAQERVEVLAPAFKTHLIQAGSGNSGAEYAELGDPSHRRRPFSPAQAAEIVGLSVHMLNYRARHGYLVPHYGGSGERGHVRYYSFRDLVVARLVKPLLDTGLEIGRLKCGIAKLCSEPRWTGSTGSTIRMLATNGEKLFFVNPNGSLRDLTHDGQLAFAFLLDVGSAQRDVQQCLPEDQLAHFTMRNGKSKPA